MAATCNLMLAALHDQLQHSDKAASEAQQALTFYQSNGYAAESAGCWVLIGRNKRDRGDFAEALASFGQVLQISEKARDSAGVASAHASMGMLLATQERYPEALKHFQIELNTAGDAAIKGYAGLQTGDLLWRLGRYDEARGILQEAEAGAGNSKRYG
jgi:tetratricopeptide (TPR) repeat protein